MVDSEASNVVRLISELGHLKLIKREGYRLAGVPSPESIADHSLRAAQLGYILAKLEKYPNPEQVCAALVFHDMGEARIGDINKVANRYVQVDETQAVADQCASIEASSGEAIKELWTEVDKGQSALSKIARNADRLEMAFTAQELQALGHKVMSEWSESVATRLETDSGKRIYQALLTTEPHLWWKDLKKL